MVDPKFLQQDALAVDDFWICKQQGVDGKRCHDTGFATEQEVLHECISSHEFHSFHQYSL